MKITSVKGIALRCPCAPISDALSTSTARQALLVRVETDTGLYGLGEAFTYGTPLAVMKYLVENTLGPVIVGADPANIEELWNTMYLRTLAGGRRSMMMGAISGIDIALWDLLGKLEHKSVCELLGQCSDRVASYASAGFYAPGKDVDALRREFEGYLSMGYTDGKLKIGRNLDRTPAPLRYMANQDWAVSVDTDWKRIEAVRKVLGKGRLIVDTNASWTAEMTLANSGMLSRLGVDMIEEPIPFEDMEGFARLCRELPEEMQVIGCETQQGLAAFTAMVKAGALDIVQPDVGWAGGITEVRRIGQMAQDNGRKISLHCFGSAVLFAASLHVAAAMPNTESFESEENPNPLKTDITTKPFEADRHMSWYVPQGEGLGIDIDWEKLQCYTVTV